MAKSAPERRGSRDRSREAVRREVERRRAERIGKTLKVAPFDPERFVHQIRMSALATIHTILYAGALTVALILLARAAGNSAAGAFGALLAIGSLYYYLKRVWDIDLTAISSGAIAVPGTGGFGTQTPPIAGRPLSVVGVFLTYFITWIMVSFLISNPPFYDGAPPEIVCCGYFIPDDFSNTTFPEIGTGHWALNNGSRVNHTVNYTVLEFGVFDNGQVANVTLSYLDMNGSLVGPIGMPLRPDGRYHFEVPALEASKSYSFLIDARDGAGHTAHAQSSLNIY